MDDDSMGMGCSVNPPCARDRATGTGIARRHTHRQLLAGTADKCNPDADVSGGLPSDSGGGALASRSAAGQPDVGDGNRYAQPEATEVLDGQSGGGLGTLLPDGGQRVASTLWGAKYGIRPLQCRHHVSVEEGGFGLSAQYRGSGLQRGYSLPLLFPRTSPGCIPQSGG